MTSALQAGVSGMLALQTKMDSIGNNIANANTTAFKSGTAEFTDLLSKTIRNATGPTAQLGGTNPSSVGMGVRVSSVATNLSQGTLQATNRGLDVAVNGNGFIGLSDGNAMSLTRNGALGIDRDGTLIQQATGLKVLAVPAGGGSVTPASTIKLPIGAASLAKATSQVTLGGNLDARVATGGSKAITATVYDSLGAAHPITLTLTRSATNTWSVAGSSADGTVSVGGTPELSFDSKGNPVAGTLPITMALTTPKGADANISFTLGMGSMTQLAQDTSATLASQDGVPPGTLSSVEIADNGEITGIFTNGLTKTMGQIMTATFSNPEGLQNIGDSLYRVTVNSGDPSFTTPGSGGHGVLKSGYLEGSNVDLTREFTDMIVTQRGYQASSRVITTSDQMLQELMQLIR